MTASLAYDCASNATVKTREKRSWHLPDHIGDVVCEIKSPRISLGIDGDGQIDILRADPMLDRAGIPAAMQSLGRMVLRVYDGRRAPLLVPTDASTPFCAKHRGELTRRAETLRRSELDAVGYHDIRVGEIGLLAMRWLTTPSSSQYWLDAIERMNDYSSGAPFEWFWNRHRVRPHSRYLWSAFQVVDRAKHGTTKARVRGRK